MKKRIKIGVYGILPIALLQEPGITLHEIKAYTSLASFQGSNDSAWPSLIEIGERAGLHPDNVSKAIKKLKDTGWVEVIRRGLHLSNVYTVLFDVPELVESTKSELVESTKSELVESTKSELVESTKSLYKINEKNKEKNISEGPDAIEPSRDTLPDEIQNGFASSEFAFEQERMRGKGIKIQSPWPREVAA